MTILTYNELNALETEVCEIMARWESDYPLDTDPNRIDEIIKILEQLYRGLRMNNSGITGVV